MGGNILFRAGIKTDKVMRGFAVPIQLVVIMTVVFAGLMVLLGTWSGSTPIYYQNLPESKFGDLLMSYGHVKENVERTIDQDSEKMFANMGDFPLDWNKKIATASGKTYKTWSEADALEDKDWENIYFGRFNQATGSYFDSVKNLGFEWITIDFKDSSVKYDSATEPGKPKLIWRFVYRVELQNVIAKDGIVNKINSTERKDKTYAPFINLNDARSCAEAFFEKAGSDDGKISFVEENEYYIKEAIKQKLNLLAQGDKKPEVCQNFDLSAEIFMENICDSDKCIAGKMKAVSYILYIKGRDRTLGGISFMNDFSNFASGQSGALTGLKKCSVGKDCNLNGDYCVKGVCGKCYAGLEGADCSQAGTNSPLGSYKCYKAISQSGGISYKCLEKKDGFYVTYLGNKISSGKTINANCALKKDPLVLEGFGSAASPTVYLNGVKMSLATGSGGKNSIYPCEPNSAPQASGQLEIYVKSGEDEYKAYGASVVYALDNCLSGISSRLDKFAYSFGNQESGKAEVSFADLKEGLSKEILNKLGNNPCEGYAFSVKEVSLSCGDLCTQDGGSNCCKLTDKTTWEKEKYSIVTLEITEEKSGIVAASPRYIITYTP